MSADETPADPVPTTDTPDSGDGVSANYTPCGHRREGASVSYPALAASVRRACGRLV